MASNILTEVVNISIYVEIEPKEWSTTSVIIGVCGVNFCTFVSDGRLSSLDEHGGYKGIKSDHFTKIKKLNPRLIYGLTGLIHKDEDILSPFDGISANKLLMSTAKKKVLGYLDEHPAVAIKRNMLLGGRNEMGQFCMYEIRMNADMDEPEIVMRKPQPPLMNFSISYSVPQTCQEYMNECIDKYLVKTMPWGGHPKLVSHLEEAIDFLSTIDPTIGGTHFVKNVF